MRVMAKKWNLSISSPRALLKLKIQNVVDPSCITIEILISHSIRSSGGGSFGHYHSQQGGNADHTSQLHIHSTCAKKRDLSEDSEPRQSDGATLPWLKVPLSPLLITQSALAVFGLGFIDAGYSGDWSRIGVISKEAEDLLKVAAFIVVPLCIFAIISISK
ncbi:hypothetical protein SAY87_029235 [Trapa incisa]|uniref:DUF7887 domain-containing protein n=1 Tax=Trapa incisa TaxID=236973 RepID=A0AAN7L3X8_9MYRT|nr:hypothetical protein SAY87_029235 [Trapa incisa]